MCGSVSCSIPHWSNHCPFSLLNQYLRHAFGPLFFGWLLSDTPSLGKKYLVWFVSKISREFASQRSQWLPKNLNCGFPFIAPDKYWSWNLFSYNHHEHIATCVWVKNPVIRYVPSKVSHPFTCLMYDCGG